VNDVLLSRFEISRCKPSKSSGNVSSIWYMFTKYAMFTVL
jgi:hypothetical protein